MNGAVLYLWSSVCFALGYVACALLYAALTADYRATSAEAGSGRNAMEKTRYVKLTQMGVSSVLPLDLAIEELREAFQYALTTDVLEVRFMDMTEAEYAALPEFNG